MEEEELVEEVEEEQVGGGRSHGRRDWTYVHSTGTSAQFCHPRLYNTRLCLVYSNVRNMPWPDRPPLTLTLATRKVREAVKGSVNIKAVQFSELYTMAAERARDRDMCGVLRAAHTRSSATSARRVVCGAHLDVTLSCPGACG